MEHLFAHNGQLADLTIDRLLTDDLSPEEAAHIRAHLDSNPDEAARVASVREEVSAPLPPLRAVTLLGRDGRLTDLTIDRLLTDDLSARDAGLVQRHLAAHAEDAARVAGAREAAAAPLPPLTATLFAQDGRLTDLAVDRLLTDDLSEAEAARVDRHLAAHAEDAARVAGAREAVAAPLPPLTANLFAQDGRLTDLAVDRLLTDDLSAAEVARVERHLAAHAEDAARVAGAREVVAAPLPPLRRRERPQLRLVKTPPELREASALPPAPEADKDEDEETAEQASNVVSFPGRAWAPAALLLAAAAAFMLVVLPNMNNGATTTDPGGGAYMSTTFRGGDMAMSVVRDGGSGSDEVLESGASVSAGDRLGFQAGAKKDGYLLIMGIDGNQETYPAYPSQPGAAAVFKKSLEVQTLGGAIQLDDTPGTDRLVGVFCEAPFSYNDIAAPLKDAAAAADPAADLGTLREGCTQQEVRLQKAPTP